MCDSSIEADARLCPSCQTDLTLFDLGGNSPDPVDVPVKDGRSIDEILASIMEGKEDHQGIFETLKSVARDSPDAGDVISAATPSAAARSTKDIGEQFLCPVCETLVAADATACPGCGAEFSEGEATEYECPVCKASVPADAALCPNCGVRFAEDRTPAGADAAAPRAAAVPVAPNAAPLALRAATTASGAPAASKPSRSPVQSRIEQLRHARQETQPRIPSGDRKLLYRELPKLVNDVKPLLVSAKRIGLEIEEGKRIINDAIQAGKSRDIERAVALIADARRSLDIAFVDFIGTQIETFLQEMRAAKGDVGVAAVTPKLLEAVGFMEAGNYDSAWDGYQATIGTFESEGKEFRDARKALDESDRLVREVQSLGMNLRGPEQLVRQGREALTARDAARALRIGKQAQDRLNRDVPSFVDEEMRKARNRLLDLKMTGTDLGKPIGLLKEASAYVKEGAWTDALRQIREFYKGIERL